MASRLTDLVAAQVHEIQQYFDVIVIAEATIGPNPGNINFHIHKLKKDQKATSWLTKTELLRSENYGLSDSIDACLE